MNRHGDKQASKPGAHAVYQPGAVRDPAIDPGLPDVPRADVSLMSALAFGETVGVLYSLARLVEQRDRHTAGHCERLASSGVALGVAMRLDSGSLLSLYVGGYLHDIGKVGIPDSILFKPGKLTGAEWETMRAHPVLGEEICRPVKSLGGVLPLIRHHHERWDGSGYPDGLRETDIPLLARVLQTVDIYDALTNPRPYKQAYSSVRALEILQEETDCGWRDKEITSLFIRTHKRMLTAMADSHIGGYGPAGISDSLRNLEALTMH
jgi:putative two-component system response regulator